MGERCGDWFFVGALTAILALRYYDLTDGWAMLLALAIGWAVNESTKEKA